jgi:signal transduction histidine kinase/ligand-binding sensor domain-containing protein/DNA-binding response OmpR family regulator
MKIRVLPFFVFLFLSFTYAQENKIVPSNQRIESFNSVQGFYQNTVNKIVADAKGYLWIATPNGLVKYDGYSFDYYYHDHANKDSLPNNFIVHLLSDSSGRLWIVTKEGLCIYLTDEEKFINIKRNAFLKEAFLKEDPKKRIWVANKSNLTIYKSETNSLDKVNKLAEINLGKELKGKQIIDIEFISGSEIIVSTEFNIYILNLNESADFTIKLTELKFDNEIKKIKKIKKIDNSIWIGTSSGLYQTFYENDRLITLKTHLNLNKSDLDKKCEIISLYRDKDKNLWAGTKQNGIYKYDTKKTNFISYKHDPKYRYRLTSNRINCFFEDNYGVLWIGTAHGGLNKFDKNQKPFHNYSHNPYDDQSISSNLITDMTEDKEGKIWISFFESNICTTEEKLNLDSGNQVYFKRLTNKLNKLKNQWVLRLYQDFKGYWWISTNKGLYLYDKNKDNLHLVQLTVRGKKINSIFNKVIDQINSNQIILGGSNILMLDNPWDAVLNNRTVEVEKQLFDLISNIQVNSYVKDSFNNYWFATTNGVLRIVNNNNGWEVKSHLTTTSNDSLKLSHNFVFTMHIGPDRNIWLGTFGGGLMKIYLNESGQPKKIKSYRKEDGLRDEAIYGILRDDQGQLWLSTDMGIGCFNIAKETFNFYDVNNGILSNNFRQSAFLKTKKGMILMGGVDGLTFFDPREINKNTISPNILLSQLKINNQSIVVGKEFNNQIILEQSISDTKTLVVDHQNRNISLDIIVQHSATPNKNKLAYQLEGVNKDWIEIEKGKTTATYTNLSPGKYKFLYKGTNGDGIWTSDTKSFTVQVLAPLYLRWWSIIIWILLGIVIIYVIFKYLVRLDKLNQNLKFEKLDKERDQKMNQAKLRFFTNISHDFKTPLSLIIGPLEKIVEQNPETENQKYFSIIQNNILRLQRLIDQLISYRKAETGNLELSYSKTTLGSFIYPLIESFEEYGQKTPLNFYHKVNEPDKAISIDIDKTERILLNLFSNAIKYSDSNREVSIEAGFIENNNGDEETLFIEISNTSFGIDPEKLERIFDRFYRGVDTKNDWDGTGIGLALCKSLVELMKGTISVQSIPDKKTIFRIVLPISNQVNFIEQEEEVINKYHEIVTDWLPPELEQIQDQTLDSTKPTLLIIDDELDIRSFLQEAFMNSYNVILAVDGEDGLEKLNQNQPHLIISDVMMPKLNGYELCEKIKSDLNYCQIPIILLTAIDDDVKKIEGLELGADDFITKPFSIKYLEVRVKKLLESKQRVFEYFSRNSFMPKASLITSTKDQQFLESINISIEKNMSNSKFGVEELASEICMSTSHFYRRLKELTGQAPNLYLRNFRLQKAAQLLKENNKLTAADIMFEIGIESKSYYSTAFKKIHGVSPSEFVKTK